MNFFFIAYVMFSPFSSFLCRFFSRERVYCYHALRLLLGVGDAYVIKCSCSINASVVCCLLFLFFAMIYDDCFCFFVFSIVLMIRHSF
jgi:hypothetical protein